MVSKPIKLGLVLILVSLWQLEYVVDVPSNLPLKFGQNGVSNSWDIADMDKFRQGICCPDKCPHDSWHLLNMGPKSYLWSWVKIRSVNSLDITDMVKCRQDILCSLDKSHSDSW